METIGNAGRRSLSLQSPTAPNRGTDFGNTERSGPGEATEPFPPQAWTAIFYGGVGGGGGL